MKRLMKKKVSVFGKSIPMFVLALFGIGLVSAALVPYLSNTITGDVDVSSPITIVVTGTTDNAEVINGGRGFAADIYGGESFTVDTTATIHIDGVTGHISENKIVGFNGEGITITYSDSDYPGYVWELPVCMVGEDAYYYIGDPTEVLNAGDSLGETTFEAALNLDPTEDLVVESRVVLAADAACTSIPAPITIVTA